MARRWRNWAYESAALDLALRQAGLSLADAVGRSVRPLRFVNSLGLGDPPSVATIARRVERYPSIGFKLDAAPSWTASIVEELAGLRCVRDGRLQGPLRAPGRGRGRAGRDVPRGAGRVPGRTARGPARAARVEALLAPVRDRVSLDAPIRAPADVGAPRTINVKPSRIGGLRPLFALYERCDGERRRDVWGRDGRARRGPRPDRAARGAVPPGRAQRRRAVGVQRPRAGRTALPSSPLDRRRAPWPASAIKRPSRRRVHQRVQLLRESSTFSRRSPAPHPRACPARRPGPRPRAGARGHAPGHRAPRTTSPRWASA